mmetsp:Transcript_75371/g.125655  ORF Transcript_75371/g.125655 Transcript_75371/m.125655 type:complete len:165 (-) Transcript_75371:448-942(-)
MPVEVDAAPTVVAPAPAQKQRWKTDEPAFPILTLNCTGTDPRRFSWVGLRVAGMTEYVKKDNPHAGLLAGMRSTTAISLVPKGIFKDRDPATVDVVILARDGVSHNWTMQDFTEALVVHSLSGEEWPTDPTQYYYVPKERGGPCGIVCETKAIYDIESISVTLR